MESTIKIIGVGDDGRLSLPPLYQKWIMESEVLIGGERHLDFFPEFPGEKVVLKGGLKGLTDRLQNETKNTVILASGDPMFYGIGGYLSKKCRVEILPHLSSIQLAFARMGASWQDAYLTSLHGRSMIGLAQRIDGKDKVALLTDQENSPNQIAKYLLSFGMSEYKGFVGENLGSSNERTGWYSLEDMMDQPFSDLNVVILKKQGENPGWTLGIPDHEFDQRKPDKGLITKREIRVLSLAQLQLRTNSIVWDIGTCTGSVAIEAARIAREGAVYAIEKNEADLANCQMNMAKFRADITAIQGKAPQGLEEFPDPNAIFIGGTGGEMRELLRICCSRLLSGGRIVLNAVTIETLYEALQAFSAEGFTTEISQIQVSKSKPILNMNRFEALNPVYIIAAERKMEEMTHD